MTAKTLPQRPWTKRGTELLVKIGGRADYLAWTEWFRRQDRRRAWQILDALDESDSVALYAIFCSVFDRMAPKKARKTA
mgnify:FL=1